MDFGAGDSSVRRLLAQRLSHAAQRSAYLGFMRTTVVLAVVGALSTALGAQTKPEQRPQARDVGVVVGVLPAGTGRNGNTRVVDVAGREDSAAVYRGRAERAWAHADADVPARRVMASLREHPHLTRVRKCMTTGDFM